MVIPRHRSRQCGKIGETAGHDVIGGPFLDPPAIILTARRTRRLKIHFFVTILPHITDIEITRLVVERKPPRIAQAQSPDFWRIVRIPDKRIVGWYGIGRSPAFHIYPQHLP